MIRFLAAFLMVVDHVGYLFFPGETLWRGVGRLSMPLFAMGIAQGYQYSCARGTQWRYLKRLLLFALASQWPYTLMFGSGTSIGVTWALSLLLLLLLNRKGLKRETAAALCAAVFLAARLLDPDYGLYGVLMPLVLNPRHSCRQRLLGSLGLWGLYMLLTGFRGTLQLLSCGAIPLAALLEPLDKKLQLRMPRYFFYIFYPAHMLALVLLHRAL